MGEKQINSKIQSYFKVISFFIWFFSFRTKAKVENISIAQIIRIMQMTATSITIIYTISVNSGMNLLMSRPSRVRALLDTISVATTFTMPTMRNWIRGSSAPHRFRWGRILRVPPRVPGDTNPNRLFGGLQTMLYSISHRWCLRKLKENYDLIFHRWVIWFRKFEGIKLNFLIIKFW